MTMTNTTNTTNNTSNNENENDGVFTNPENLLRWGHLEFNEALLHKGEMDSILENWDGEARLSNEHKTPLMVCVHNGAHHLDEVFSVALLSLLWDRPTVVCSRDPQIWESADLVIDVGEGLLDHHGIRACKGISAATRVFLLLRNTLYDGTQKSFWKRLADLTVRVAALDTGLCEPGESPFPWVFEALRAGAIKGESESTLVQRIADDIVIELSGECGPYWEDRRAAERKTVADAAAAAKAAIDEAIAAAGDSGIPVFPSSCRWGETNEELWKSSNQCPYYIGQEGDDDWRILCAAPKGGEFSPFSSIALIPIQYRGLRGDALSEKTGIPGGIFCHAAGFIAGFKTCEGAVAFAELCRKAVRL